MDILQLLEQLQFNIPSWRLESTPNFVGDKLGKEIYANFEKYELEKGNEIIRIKRRVSRYRSATPINAGGITPWSGILTMYANNNELRERPPVPAIFVKKSMMEALVEHLKYVKPSRISYTAIRSYSPNEQKFKLKFLDPPEDFNRHFDDKDAALRAAHLLLFYARADITFAQVALVIRKWNMKRLASVLKDTIVPNYGLELMLVQYLQVGCRPPVLPCLHKLSPNSFDQNSNINSLPDIDQAIEESESDKTLDALLIGFFNYYRPPSQGGFDYMRKKISVKNGNHIDLEEPSEVIYVEDPFSGKNVINNEIAYDGPSSYGKISSIASGDTSLILTEIFGLVADYLDSNRSLNALMAYKFD